MSGHRSCRLLPTDPGKRLWIETFPNFRDWREQGTSFSVMVGATGTRVNLTGAGTDAEPEEVRSALVTERLFEFLGVTPLRGRDFRDADHQAGHHQVTVLSYDLWSRRFAADPNIVEREIRLNGRPYSVVGVMRPGVRFPEEAQLWLPLAFTPEREPLREARSSLWLPVYGRLAPGVTLAAAQNEMSVVARRLAKAFPDANRETGILLEPLRKTLVGDNAPWITIVGVVANARRSGLDQDVRPSAFLPYQQYSRRVMTVLVRTMGDPLALVEPARRAVRGLDANQPITEVRTLENVLASSSARRRFVAVLLALFAGLAVTLAAVGIYGVMAYIVGQRAREIGIRVALGARRVEVVRWVLGEGMTVVGAGVAVGLVAAAATTRFLRLSLRSLQLEWFTRPTRLASVPHRRGLTGYMCLTAALCILQIWGVSD